MRLWKGTRRPGAASDWRWRAWRHFSAAVVALVLSAAALAIPNGPARSEAVAIYTYHTHPPFLTGDREGLTYDLAAFLNAFGKGRYSFRVQSLSRPRLNKLISKPGAAIVPWVNPAWFGDTDESKYLWSSRALMNDANSIISRADTRLVYDGPWSLEGLVFGAIRGHVYTGIDDFVGKSSSTRRVDADNHFNNFRKLMTGRIDVTLTPRSAALYLIRRDRLADKLFVSPKPHSTYQRRLLIVDRREDIKAFVDEALDLMNSDSAWLTLMESYR